MITICFTYFKSLTLANLAAALYSVSRQDLSKVKEVVIVDNDTNDLKQDILDVIVALKFPVPVRLWSEKHMEITRTHSWSTNRAVREVTTPWFLFTRADYLLAFDVVKKFSALAEGNRFITSNGCHLGIGVEECERSMWRTHGPRWMDGVVFDYTIVDTGVYMMCLDAFNKVDGLDESLTAWGHAQTDFQYRLHESGVEFARISETLFWHPGHGGEKDIELAHKQLAGVGRNLKKMWARYEGVNPYASL